MDETKKIYEEWFERARDDELSASAILEEKHGSPNTVCFLAQQMAEKYLKGLLVSFEKFPEKTHDLLRLASFVVQQDPAAAKETEELKAELDVLSNYYIETRYPGDYPEFHWGNAEDALIAARRIKNFVLEIIKKSKAL